MTDRERARRQLHVIAEALRRGRAVDAPPRVVTRHHGSADRFARDGDADVLDSDCAPVAGDAAFLEDAGPIDPEAPIVASLAHIGNKRMTPVRDPSRPRRAEDAEGIARPETALRRRGAG